jgi:hypothetical protein
MNDLIAALFNTWVALSRIRQMKGPSRWNNTAWPPWKSTVA